jgi:hypothetical protein
VVGDRQRSSARAYGCPRCGGARRVVCRGDLLAEYRGANLLARTARAEAGLEEILSRNGNSSAHGAALPALGIRSAGPSLLQVDLPLVSGLGLAVALLALIPMALPVAALGYWCSGWRPAAEGPP